MKESETLEYRAARMRTHQLRELANESDEARAAVKAEVDRRIRRFIDKLKHETGTSEARTRS